MGCLGSSLDDYYSYQLLDKVAEQIDSGDTGNIKKLQDSLNNVMTKIAAHNKRVKKSPKAKYAKRMSNNAMVDAILSRCLTCGAKSADCAYGDLCGSQSCYDS